MDNGAFKTEMIGIGHQLRQLLNDVSGNTLMYGNVVSVDEDNNTMDVRVGDNNLVITGISLAIISGGDASVFCYPEINSLVLLAMPYNQTENTMCLRFTTITKAIVKIKDYSCEISQENISLLSAGGASMVIEGEDIVFNGGSLDGLVTINELTEKLNALVNAFNSHIHTTTATVGSSPTVGIISTSTTQASLFNATDYMNNNIKQ